MTPRLTSSDGYEIEEWELDNETVFESVPVYHVMGWWDATSGELYPAGTNNRPPDPQYRIVRRDGSNSAR